MTMISMFCSRIPRPLWIASALISLPMLGAPQSGNARATEGSGSALANVEVLIVRHAERQGEEDKLTPAGLARASAYARYFKTLTLGGRHIRLAHLIAEKSERTRRTLEPLSKAIHLPLDTRFSNKQYQALADDLRAHPYGREILICWHHGKIPDLIRAFGGDPDLLIANGKWPKGTYDWIVDLRFDAAGKLSDAGETIVHEHLMPGDSQ
jgi:phosphohistidine phosphatase SixA